MNPDIEAANTGFIRLDADPRGVAVVGGVEYWINVTRKTGLLKLEFVKKTPLHKNANLRLIMA